MTTLEDRYRRLLGVYPRRHRLFYQEEMLGVLLADAKPGQRCPSVRDCADIAGSAATVRLRRAGDVVADPDWRDAAQAVLLFGAMCLFALGARPMVSHVTAVVLQGRSWAWDGTTEDTIRPVLWALVIGATVVRARRCAAVFAAAALTAEIVRVAAWYGWSPTQVLNMCWLLTIAVVVAGAAGWLATGAPARDPRGIWRFAGVAALIAASGAADGMSGFELTWQFSLFGRSNGLLSLHRLGAPLCAVLALLAAWSWWRQPTPVRLRMLVFAAPVAAVLVLVPWGFGDFMYASQRSPDPDLPIYLAWFQWLELVAVPGLAFAVAGLAVHRWERTRRPGREAERPEVAPRR